MPSLLAEAMERQTAIVSTWQKLAERNRPSAQLPEIGARIATKQSGLFGSSYTDNVADRFRYFKDWVYVAIHCIADRVAGLAWQAAEITNAAENPERSYRRMRHKVPARILQKANSSQELKSIASHEALDLLARPNSWQRKYEFLYFTVANLEIAGEVYWIVGKDDDSEEEALFAVPSHWIEYKRDQNAYRLKPRGDVEGVEVPAEFVARAYLPNPSDPLSCYSPLVACFSAVRIDRYIQSSQDQTFQRGIHPNLIVTVGSDPASKQRPTLTGAQRRQFVRAIREIWSQTVNVGDPVILDSLIESVHKLHLTPQEMDWPASGEIVKERIFQTYRINPYVVGQVVNINKASAVVAEQTFNSQVVNPLAGAISEMATDFLGPRYESPKRLLMYLEQAVAEDPDQQLRIWSTLRRNDDVTQDEIRGALLGLSPLEKRDDPSILLQYVGGLSNITMLLQQIAIGMITIDQALGILTRLMRMTEEDARAIIGKPVIRLQLPSPESAPQISAIPEAGEQSVRIWPVKSTEPDAEKAARRKAIEESRVKQFEETADSLEGVLDQYFAESVARLVKAVKGATLDPEHAEEQAARLLDEVFDPKKELSKLLEAAVPPLMAAFGKGVAQQREETKQFKRTRTSTKKPRKKPLTTAEQFAEKYDLDVPELSAIVDDFRFAMRMPDWMLEEAFTILDDTFSRDYWQKIPESTRGDVEVTLRNAIEEGKSIREISNELLDKHGETYTRARANAVARTESGSMLNSGHSAGIEELAEETGLEIRKTWLSVLGSTTRQSHADLHETLADDEGMFELGGVRVPYPSHPDLDVSERANCQCSIVSSIL